MLNTRATITSIGSTRNNDRSRISVFFFFVFVFLPCSERYGIVRFGRPAAAAHDECALGSASAVVGAAAVTASSAVPPPTARRVGRIDLHARVTSYRPRLRWLPGARTSAGVADG